MARDFAKAFYLSNAWRSCRDAYASSVGWLCEDCLENGIYTPGEIVHHKKHLTPKNINDKAIALGWSNLRLVCRDCHAKQHKKQIEMRYCFDDDGNVCPPYREIW